MASLRVIFKNKTINAAKTKQYELDETETEVMKWSHYTIDIG